MFRLEQFELAFTSHQFTFASLLSAFQALQSFTEKALVVIKSLPRAFSAGPHVAYEGRQVVFSPQEATIRQQLVLNLFEQ